MRDTIDPLHKFVKKLPFYVLSFLDRQQCSEYDLRLRTSANIRKDTCKTFCLDSQIRNFASKIFT